MRDVAINSEWYTILDTGAVGFFDLEIYLVIIFMRKIFIYASDLRLSEKTNV